MRALRGRGATLQQDRKCICGTAAVAVAVAVADWWQLSVGWQLYDTWRAIMCIELARNSSVKFFVMQCQVGSQRARLQLATCNCNTRQAEQSRAKGPEMASATGGGGGGGCWLSKAATCLVGGFAALRPFPALGREMMHKSCVCPDVAAH